MQYNVLGIQNVFDDCRFCRRRCRESVCELFDSAHSKPRSDFCAIAILLMRAPRDGFTQGMRNGKELSGCDILVLGNFLPQRQIRIVSSLAVA